MAHLRPALFAPCRHRHATGTRDDVPAFESIHVEADVNDAAEGTAALRALDALRVVGRETTAEAFAMVQRRTVLSHAALGCEHSEEGGGFRLEADRAAVDLRPRGSARRGARSPPRRPEDVRRAPSAGGHVAPRSARTSRIVSPPLPTHGTSMASSVMPRFISFPIRLS
jgi:hypothetical protein